MTSATASGNKAFVLHQETLHSLLQVSFAAVVCKANGSPDPKSSISDLHPSKSK